MPHAAVRQHFQRPDHFRHEPIDLSRGHQAGKVRLGFQEGPPAIGHQFVHVVHGLNRHALQGLPEAVPLTFPLGNLPAHRLLRQRLDIGIDQQPGQAGQHLVCFADFALESRRLGPVRFQGFGSHHGHFLKHAVHVFKGRGHGTLNAGHELVFPDRRPVVAGGRSDARPPAARVVDVLPLAVAALPRVVNIATPGAEQMPGERPQLDNAAGNLHRVGGNLLLSPGERRVIDEPQGVVTLESVALLVVEAGHATPGRAIKLEAPAEVADLSDQHPIRQNGADRAATPGPPEPRRDAPLLKAPGDLSESHGLGEVRLKDEANRLGLFRVNREPLLSIVATDDAIPIGRRPAGPAALFVPLNQAGPRSLRQDAAVVSCNHQLHAASECVRAFGYAHDLYTAGLKILDKHVRFGSTAEAIELVDVQPADPPGFCFLDQTQELRTTARRAPRLRLIDEVLQRPTRRPLARLNLNRNARGIILGVAGVAGVQSVVPPPRVTTLSAVSV